MHTDRRPLERSRDADGGGEAAVDAVRARAAQRAARRLVAATGRRGRPVRWLTAFEVNRSIVPKRTRPSRLASMAWMVSR